MAKKVVKKPAAKKTGKAKETLLVVSKVKAALREHQVNVASDAPEALNEVLYNLVDQAAKRAAANGRKTVRAHDFLV